MRHWNVLNIACFSCLIVSTQTSIKCWSIIINSKKINLLLCYAIFLINCCYRAILLKILNKAKKIDILNIFGDPLLFGSLSSDTSSFLSFSLLDCCRPLPPAVDQFREQPSSLCFDPLFHIPFRSFLFQMANLQIFSDVSNLLEAQAQQRIAEIAKLTAEKDALSRVVAHLQQEAATLMQEAQKQADALLARVRKEADAMLSAAHAEAAVVVSEARREADAVLADAHEKTAAVLRGAQERAEHAEGFQHFLPESVSHTLGQTTLQLPTETSPSANATASSCATASRPLAESLFRTTELRTGDQPAYSFGTSERQVPEWLRFGVQSSPAVSARTEQTPSVFHPRSFVPRDDTARPQGHRMHRHVVSSVVDETTTFDDVTDPDLAKALAESLKTSRVEAQRQARSAPKLPPGYTPEVRILPYGHH